LVEHKGAEILSLVFSFMVLIFIAYGVNVMKKIINDPFKVTDELVQGFVLAHKPHFYQLPGKNVVVKSHIPEHKKVSILIGGGSGHEPLFLGFLGKGMADCCVDGNIFASPSVDLVYEGIKAAHTDEGVIMIYGNFQGDIINFSMANMMAQAEGIRVEEIRVWDDVASAPPEQKEERRGTSANLAIIKIAGAASERGMSFDEVLRVTEKARANSRSIGIALSSCSLPAVGKPIFELGEDEIYIGMGVHGEPGIEKRKLCSANEMADTMLEAIFNDDLSFESGGSVVMIVNSYGATTQMELLILAKALHERLAEKGINVHYTAYGDLCTSLEMAGVSLTLMKLDDELRSLWDDEAESPGFFKTRTLESE